MPRVARYPRLLRIGFSNDQRVWLEQEAQRRASTPTAIVREMVQAAMRTEQRQERAP